MGKGGRCVPSKKKPPPDLPDEAPIEADTDADSTALPIDRGYVRREIENTDTVLLHVRPRGRPRPEDEERRGLRHGVEGVLFRVPETLSDEVLAQMRAQAKDDEIPEIASEAELVGADGFLFGFSTRYGCMAAQMKAISDSTGQLWREQKLAGKPTGFFVSTGTQGGEQETTAQASH